MSLMPEQIITLIRKHTMKLDNLKLLRDEFPANQISKLPKPTRQQTEAVKNNFKEGIRCQVCGGWHHPKVIHLDYVGHAALTDRLLDVDSEWNWKPLSVTEQGLPQYDSINGLWIELTVCGVTRLGYGHAGAKAGGDAIKEVIGDALRNAAMRFGAALDLWHKGDLHASDNEGPEEKKTPTKAELKEKWNDVNDSLFRLFNLNDAPGMHQVLNEINQNEKREAFSTMPNEVKQFISDNQEVK